MENTRILVDSKIKNNYENYYGSAFSLESKYLYIILLDFNISFISRYSFYSQSSNFKSHRHKKFSCKLEIKAENRPFNVNKNMNLLYDNSINNLNNNSNIQNNGYQSIEDIFDNLNTNIISLSNLKQSAKKSTKKPIKESKKKYKVKDNSLIQKSSFNCKEELSLKESSCFDFEDNIKEESNSNFDESCFNCLWKFPSLLSSSEINIHINLCLDGKGEENINQHKMNMNVIYELEKGVIK